jgi:hypothetical protein
VVWGTPGASFSALLLAADMIRTGTEESVVVAAIDCVGPALGHALRFLACPDQALFRGIAAAARLSRRPGGGDSRARMLRLEAGHELGWEDAPATAVATPADHAFAVLSGCTTEDVSRAAENVRGATDQSCVIGRSHERFLGADALVRLGRTLQTSAGPFIVSVANRFGGTGLMLVRDPVPQTQGV